MFQILTDIRLSITAHCALVFSDCPLTLVWPLQDPCGPQGGGVVSEVP